MTKVYNLTDVSTPALEQRNLVAKHLAVAHRMVNPGEYVEIPTEQFQLAQVAYLLQVGAVSVDQIPPAYAQAKQKEAAQASAHGSIPAKHVFLAETNVAQASGKPSRAKRSAKGGWR